MEEDFEPIAMWIHTQCRKLYVTTLEGVNNGDCELIVTFQAFLPEMALAVSSLYRS